MYKMQEKLMKYVPTCENCFNYEMRTQKDAY